MPRISADMLILAPQFTNALKDREIDLRGQKIAVIENMGPTLDQFDTIDFTGNDIRKIGGFPRLERLKTLLLARNRVIRIAPNLQQSIPNLEEVTLTGNLIAELGDIMPLQTLPKLVTLNLIENPVAKMTHYRKFVIHSLPNLKLLDFHKVRQTETAEANEFFESSEGAAFLERVEKETQAQANKAVTGSSASTTRDQTAGGLSVADEMRIKAAIANAKSLEEVNALEAQLKAGGGKLVEANMEE